MKHDTSPTAVLEDLRRRIAEIERPPVRFEDRGAAERDALAWRFGLDEADRLLPPEGLSPGGLHEAAGDEHRDGPTAGAFLLALLRRLECRDGRSTILMCQSDEARRRFGTVYGPGLAALGFDPDRLLVAATAKDTDVLWAVEEGLASGALAAVVAEVDTLPFAASRRLSLAAQESATPALLLRADGLAPASAAMTRWRVAALPGLPDTIDDRAPGPGRWRLDLVRCRGGRPATLDVEWNRETGDFGLAAPLADRPAAPGDRAADAGAEPALRRAG